MLKILLLAAALSNANSTIPALEYAKYFVVISEKHDEDPFLAAATGVYESMLDNLLVSEKGACCLMQVMGDKYDVFPACRKVRKDIGLCIEAGVRYLAQLRKNHSEDEEVLCRYNAGTCGPRSRDVYARGVLWWRHRLLAVASNQPAGMWHCRVEIEDPAGYLTDEASAPVWIRAIPHGRPAIRNYEKKVAKDLKLTLKYRTCSMRHLGRWNGKFYLDEGSKTFECLTSRRRFSCRFEDLHGEDHTEILETWAQRLDTLSELPQNLIDLTQEGAKSNANTTERGHGNSRTATAN